MKKKNYKGRTEKRALGKCEGVCRFYSDIQSRYADRLQEREDVVSFRCNVLMDTDDYTTDFVITRLRQHKCSIDTAFRQWCLVVKQNKGLFCYAATFL